MSHFAKVLSLSFLCIGLLSPSLGLTKEGGRHDGHKGILKKLDLTEEQKAKLAEMRKGEKDEMRALHEKIREKRKKLKEAMKSSASKSELQSLHKEIQKLRNEKADKKFNRALSIREVLTPEQRKKFEELKGEKHGKKGHRRGKRHDAADDDEADEE